MKTTELKSNSQYGPQDPQSQEARSSWEPSSDSKSYGETCNNTVEHIISGVPLAAVEPQNTIRENKVKRLIEKFENHKHKESFIQDLSQTQKINKFDLNNTEIFQLCENASKQQCLECDIQKMYYQARQMLKKARQEKHGLQPTVLSRWYAEEEYRKSLSAIGGKNTT